jgi:hypothetical protein
VTGISSIPAIRMATINRMFTNLHLKVGVVLRVL